MSTISRVSLTGKETLAELKALGLTSKEARWRARTNGYYVTSRRPEYPQLEGPGAWAVFNKPLGFVKRIILKETRNTRRYIDEDTIQEWIQEALLRCWERRHAPHITHPSSYYYAMVRGLVRQWIVRYRANHVRHIPLHTSRAA